MTKIAVIPERFPRPSLRKPARSKQKCDDGCAIKRWWDEEPDDRTETTLPIHSCDRCNGLVEQCSDCKWRGGHIKGHPCHKCGGRVERRRCKMMPLVGMNVCRAHGGALTRNKQHAANLIRTHEALERAGSLIAHYAIDDPNRDPIEGMLEAIWRSSATMRAFGVLAAEVDAAMVRGGKDGVKVDPVIGMYQQTMMDHAKLCKLALDGGIEQRMIDLREGQADRMVAIMGAFLGLMLEALTDAGVDRPILAELKRTRAPALMRAAIETTATTVSD